MVLIPILDMCGLHNILQSNSKASDMNLLCGWKTIDCLDSSFLT